MGINDLSRARSGHGRQEWAPRVINGYGAGVIDLSAGERLLLTGPQALWFLDQLVTNQVKDLPIGSGSEALLLTPKGRIVAAMRILSTARGALAAIEPGPTEQLEGFFAQRVFTTRVRIEDVTGQLGLVRIVGPAARRVAAAALGLENMPEGEHSNVELGFGFIAALPRQMEGLDLFVERESVPGLIEAIAALGAAALSETDYERHRIASGVPRFGVDFGQTHLPQEAALERAVHFKKGCYLGQESVAMAQRGKVKKRIRHLHFEGPATVGRIVFGGMESGTVTSSATLDGVGFGIGTVATATPLEARVEVLRPDGGGSSAVVHELPGTAPGPVIPSARELRERLQGTASAP
jgi:tRNA-modifying protein YgfZ